MIRTTTEQINRQHEFAAKIKKLYSHHTSAPLAMVDTYGCQQNEADSQRIRGWLTEMGFEQTDDEALADVIVINTCAVRENAENRVFGNVGALVHTKRRKGGEQTICITGCMVQQAHIAERIKKSFRHVDLVFGTHAQWRFPELLYKVLSEKKRVVDIEDCDGYIAEGQPVLREKGVKGWLSIMYGCNNFCTYCIVPYVRGRERSRLPEDVIAEAKELIASGVKDITLLGQNVNSYGKDLGLDMDFADLVAMINDLEGDFVLRFMTSHPKDASKKLFDTMARCDKVAKVFHLPFQAGNDRVLKVMNRRYTAASYLELVDYARSVMPDIVLTSDVIVGFPGETDEEFEDTLKLVERVGFDALFTFIYSARVGTPAAKMEQNATREEIQKRFDRLVELQNNISAQRHESYVGKTYRVLADGHSDDIRFPLTGRTDGNRLVRFVGDDSVIGNFVNVKITGHNTWSLTGEIV